jgi:hypothetical protein
MKLCVYCGELATTRDHAPPRYMSRLGGKTYPACKECNQRLGAMPLDNIQVRAEWLSGYFKRRLKRSPSIKLRYRYEWACRVAISGSVKEVGK